MDIGELDPSEALVLSPSAMLEPVKDEPPKKIGHGVVEGQSQGKADGGWW